MKKSSKRNVFGKGIASLEEEEVKVEVDAEEAHSKEETEMETDGAAAAADYSKGKGVVRQPSVMTVSDHDVLNCSVCYCPLTIPVFQCKNEHLSCFSCCNELGGKCPSCRCRIGQIRNRGIEKILESAKVTCQNRMYGCKEKICNRKECDHEETCAHSPCSCPLQHCDFVGSYTWLYQHFTGKHMNSVIQFEYNVPFFVQLCVDERVRVLQKVNNSVSFVLLNCIRSYGNAMSINCIAPSSKAVVSEYDIRARDVAHDARRSDVHGGSAHMFQSRTGSVQTRDDIFGLRGSFSLLPSEFVSGSNLVLKICI